MLSTVAHARPDDTEPAHAAPPNAEVTVLMVAVAAMALGWIVMRQAVKLPLHWRLIVLLAMLLLTGVAGFGIAPLVSAFALAVGFGLTLIVVFIGLRRPE